MNKYITNYSLLFLFFSGDLAITNLVWHATGDSIMLTSKDQMCMCFLKSPSADESF